MPLSLFAINTRLYALMEARREVIAEEVFTEEQKANRDASLVEIDKAIREYVFEEIKTNPNSVHQYLLECRARQADLKAEIQRLDGLLANEEADEGRAKELVLEVMRAIGKKALPVRGKLATQGNGGPQPVEVAQPELVPNEFKRVTVTLSFDVWRHILDRYFGAYSGAAQEPAIVAAITEANEKARPEPNLIAIREALLRREPCPKCRGFKTISDMQLQRGNVIHIQTPCDECGATGEIAGGVPGCRLMDRGEHLRIS